MRSYRKNSHSKHDLKVHLIWIPKYRKRVLVGKVAERVRDVLRQVSMEHEIHIISGKVASDHVHMFISYRPQQAISKLVQYLKGTSSRILLQEFTHLQKQFWGRHFWARGYMAISSGNITDEMIQEYTTRESFCMISD
jgi:putative transposase